MDVPDPTIRVFDGVGARDGDVVVEIKGTRQRRLLALLTIRAGTVADVDWLSECLWDDESRPDDTMPPVRTAVYRLQDIVQSWAPDPLSSASLTQAVATFRFVTGTYTCELGQQSPFDLQPCEMTDSQLTATYEVPFEPTGTFEGSGTYSGVWLQVMEEARSSTPAAPCSWARSKAAAPAPSTGPSRMCAGFFDQNGLNYSAGTSTILRRHVARGWDARHDRPPGRSARWHGHRAHHGLLHL